MRFKVNDVVYHHEYGKGSVLDVFHNAIKVDFDSKIMYHMFSFAEADKTLSFTPYDFVNGGFSSKRPLPDIKDGDVVYVRHLTTSCAGLWELRYFKTFCTTTGRPITYSNQKQTGEDTTVWSEVSIENPLKQ